MKVILLQDIKNVGKKDQTIEASPGYARNYLLPKKLAVEANPTNMNILKNKKASQAHKKDIEKQQAEKIKKQLESVTINVKTNVGDNGKIFGSITSKNISEAIKEQLKIEIDKKKIILEDNIKTIGMYKVQIKLLEGVSGNIKINVS